MRLLLALPMLLAAATTAYAQYSVYPPPAPAYPPPGYPPSAPAYSPPGYAPYPQNGPMGQPPTDSDQPAQPGGSARSLATELLAPQNAVRASVGEAPLEWSDRLADAAQVWAAHLAATGQFAHYQGDPYGENLYEITGGSASPQEVVDAWADEARYYDIATNSCTSVCGHYTQIVWRSTRAVGCGVAGGGDREVWVCEYDPPGNVIGFRPY